MTDAPVRNDDGGDQQDDRHEADDLTAARPAENARCRTLLPSLPAPRTGKRLHRADGQRDVGGALDELDAPAKDAAEIASHIAAVEDRLREAPERIAGKADAEEEEQNLAPRVACERVEGALRVRGLAPGTEREPDRERADDPEADALRRKAGAARIPEPVAACYAAGSTLGVVKDSHA